MLARSGVARRHLIDAALADVGTPKVQLVARALHATASSVQVDPRVELWRRGADDVIDNIGTKVELLAYCVQNNIKAFSSMGAGTISDPTRIQIADLSAAHHDPLARAVLFHSERPSPPRRRLLPALFGLHIVTYVLCELAGRPLERPFPVRHRKKLYERMWKDLLHRE
ncbi:hypothetical protein BGW80DRAFT_1440670 [Lactifluus volemus]|nr:hypothetical protein BGW80DRAFT_1440670 [Lactifluus volemus]